MTTAEGAPPGQALLALPGEAQPDIRAAARTRPAWRIRRRRALAAALRRVAGREVLDLPPGPLRARLLAIAGSQGVFLPPEPEADLSELIARIDPGTTLPPELVPVLAALLQPLFGPPAASLPPPPPLPLPLPALETMPSEPRSPAR